MPIKRNGAICAVSLFLWLITWCFWLVKASEKLLLMWLFCSADLAASAKLRMTFLILSSTTETVVSIAIKLRLQRRSSLLSVSPNRLKIRRYVRAGIRIPSWLGCPSLGQEIPYALIGLYFVFPSLSGALWQLVWCFGQMATIPSRVDLAAL